jgi:hypothetical protein
MNPEPGGTKTDGSYGSGSRSGSATLVSTVLYLDHEDDAKDRGRQAGGEQVPHTAILTIIA